MWGSCHPSTHPSPSVRPGLSSAAVSWHRHASCQRRCGDPKQERTADRVVLGPDDEGVKKFVLTGNTQLSGRGSVRVQVGWKDFAFVCDLDPTMATVKSFTYKLDAK